jgi:hypothetical protein
VRKIFSVRNILTLLGALVIGALGSGIWDTLLKPMFSWLGTALLDVATLGKQSLIDGIYVEVAKGSYERAANATYQLLITVLGVAGIVIPLAALALLVLLRKIDAGDSAVAETVVGFYRRFFFKTGFALLIVECLLVGALVIETARLGYIIRASNFLEQSQRIIAPNVDQDQRLLTASMIAQMSTKAEFIKIVDGLRSVADAHNVKLPEFSAF